MRATVRILWAAALAGACAAFAGTSAYVDYAGLRVRAVKAPIVSAADGVSVPLGPDKLRGLEAPFAVIVSLRNDAPAAASFAVRIDGRDVCAPIVAAGRASRVDCVFAGEWNPQLDHLISVASASPSWAVEALEVSTHHGSNSGLVPLFVLPAGSRQYRPPGLGACAILGLALWALLSVPMPALPKALRFAHRVVVGLFILWTAAVVLAPAVSAFRVIVSADSLVRWLAVCLSPQIYALVSPALSALVRARLRIGPVSRAIVAGGLAAACFAIVVEQRVAEDYGGNHSGLLLLARTRIDAIPMLAGRDDVKGGLVLLDGGGYDGQFMYAIAFDPYLRRFGDRPRLYQPFIDNPPYRYGRVGFPAVVQALSLNRPERFPSMMIGLVFAGIFGAAAGIAWLAQRSGSTEWLGLLVALVPGFWMSFRSGLPEPLAAAAAVVGYLCVRDRRWIAGGLLLAAACLVRETAAFFVVCIAGWLALSKQPRRALGLLVIALGPLALWRLYVGWVFAPAWGFEAFWNPPDDFGVPFGGVATLWSQLSDGSYWPELWEMRRGSLAYSFLVLGGSWLAWALAWFRPGAVTAAAALFGVMAVCFNVEAVWVQTGNAERLTSDLFLLLAVATAEAVGASRTWRVVLLTFWAIVAAYLLFGTLDADFTRRALIGIFP